MVVGEYLISRISECERDRLFDNSRRVTIQFPRWIPEDLVYVTTTARSEDNGGRRGNSSAVFERTTGVGRRVKKGGISRRGMKSGSNRSVRFCCNDWERRRNSRRMRKCEILR